MKKRNGFISNSSSSSFIVAGGIITDRQAFDTWAKKYGHTNFNKWDDPIVVTTSDILDIINKNSDDRTDIHWILDEILDQETMTLVCSNFDGEMFRIPIDLSKDETYLVVSISNDEGDGAFHEEGYELNYDIGEDYFSDTQKSWFVLGKESFIKNYEYTFGATRNG